MSASGGVVCGGSVCPTCDRPTWVIFGPCPECCEMHQRTGRFRPRATTRDSGTPPESEEDA